MKKFFIFLLTIALIGGGIFFYNKYNKGNAEAKKIKEIKDGWHIEIHADYINIREKADRYSKSNSTVKKGEVYKVLDIFLDDPSFYWYNIQIDDKTTGWVANPIKGTYLYDYNNPKDIIAPTIKLKSEEYHVNSITDIKYDNIEITDDRNDYTITHIVYHELNEIKEIDQYWIKYTVTDKSGKTTNKTQKITFNINPSEKEVSPLIK